MVSTPAGCIGCALLLLPAMAASFAQEDSSNPTKAILEGIEIPTVGWVPLRLPVLKSGENVTEIDRAGVLSQLSGQHGWEKFSSASLNAPVIIQIEAVKGPHGTRMGYRAYSAFIAYAKIDVLRDQELMEATFGAELKSEASDKPSFEELSAQDLEKQFAAADLESTFDHSQRYARMRLPLFNRVVVEGVVRLHSVEQDDSQVLFWQLDPRFSADKQSPDHAEATLGNTWVKLIPNNVGRLVPSEPTAYQGLGGYTSVVATGLAPNQLLIETGMVIYEPLEWFSGSQFLRAKLLLSMQESARSFRRKLSN